MSISYKNNRALHLGVQSMDCEHRNLFKLLDDINQKVSEKKFNPHFNEVELIDTAILELFNYISRHFKSEEGLMKANGITVDEHIKEHQEFHEKVERLKNKQDLKIRELTDFIMNWLVDHILEIDKQAAEQIKAVSSNKVD